MTPYSSAIVNVWRGKLVGTGPTIAFVFEESSDGNNWTACTGGTSFDPGEDTEVQKTVTLTKQWMRLKVTVAGTSGQVATCWAVGFLEQRLS